MPEAFVSVIVPTRNGSRTIEACVRSLMEQDYPSFEVVVIDDGSTDATPGILCSLERAFPRLSVLTRAGGGPSAARNQALAETKGEFIAFTDDDCVADRQWLRALLAGFTAEPAIAGIGGVQLPPADDTMFGKRVAAFLQFAGMVAEYVRRGTAAVIPVLHNPSCNVMYRKDILLQVGGFDESLWPGEDVELDYRIIRAGHALRATPAARVFHYRPRTMRAFAAMMCRYGAVQALLVRRYGCFRAVHYAPLVLAGLLVLLLVVGFAGGSGVALFIAALPAAALLLHAVRSTPNVQGVFWNLLLTVVTAVSWNAGYLGAWLRPQRAGIQTES